MPAELLERTRHTPNYELVDRYRDGVDWLATQAPRCLQVFRRAHRVPTGRRCEASPGGSWRRRSRRGRSAGGPGPERTGPGCWRWRPRSRRWHNGPNDTASFTWPTRALPRWSLRSARSSARSGRSALANWLSDAEIGRALVRGEYSRDAIVQAGGGACAWDPWDPAGGVHVTEASPEHERQAYAVRWARTDLATATQSRRIQRRDHPNHNAPGTSRQGRLHLWTRPPTCLSDVARERDSQTVVRSPASCLSSALAVYNMVDAISLWSAKRCRRIRPLTQGRSGVESIGGTMVALLSIGIALVVLGAVLLIFRRDENARGEGFGIKVNAPTSIWVMLAGVVCVVLYVWTPWQADSSGGSDIPLAHTATSSSTPPTVTEPPNIKAVSIKNGQGITISRTVVRGKADLEFGGPATDIGSDSLWIFDYDPNDELYYRDSDKALAMKEGDPWSFVDGPIGDDGGSDKGTTYRVVVVRATRSCSARLGALRPNGSGDIVLKSLPAGCAEAAWVNVLKTGP